MPKVLPKEALLFLAMVLLVVALYNTSAVHFNFETVGLQVAAWVGCIPVVLVFMRWQKSIKS